jgi:xanthine dehydrogenase iron-sulfur cluster and FAD-binding subunit A
VALVDRDMHGQPTYRAINSCIALLPMFAGREVITVDGLAEGAKLHPAQSAMVEHYGSQCGYCTPGMLVTARDIVLRLPDADQQRIRHELAGNLCRCTGYRGIVLAIERVLAQRCAAGAAPAPEHAGTQHAN